MKLTPIDPRTAFPLDSEEIASFGGPYAPYRISGPPGLARLVMHGRAPTKDKDYWFDEGLFTRLRERAKTEFAHRTSSRDSFATPRRMLVGLYMKLCLRSDLAICKNWTPDFDSYAILPLRPVDNLVAWVGKIKGQPYYSEPDRAAKDYAEKKAAHDLARSAVSLLGGELQFIVSFTHEQNQLHRSRVLGPFAF